MTCPDCKVPLPENVGRGRPRVRCAPCQEKHRAAYLRDAKRRERAR